MISYTAKPHPLPTPIKTLVGFCDLIIDDKIIVTGFKVFEGKTGLYIKAPSQVTKQVDEKGNPKYIDTTRFLDEKENEKDFHTPFQKEVYEAMIDAFQKASGKASTSTGTTGKGPETKPAPAPRTVNPLWG